ncbi:hypothetical protein OGAPHI_007388 [Ogataea philodendri]|uniref:Uncharacterized protein n=1 Tax=Ogataea philodendri TaxID=1378263 RepID=A0A9P8SYY8_9ASCO|nr:uncharacterized protein OGAPHI_007388 [Ogataea philodendri]KAH3660183.1 hypothetical protein OGAPHI_007388 [Ogataea philodendri]
MLNLKDNAEAPESEPMTPLSHGGNILISGELKFVERCMEKSGLVVRNSSCCLDLKVGLLALSGSKKCERPCDTGDLSLKNLGFFAEEALDDVDDDGEGKETVTDGGGDSKSCFGIIITFGMEAEVPDSKQEGYNSWNFEKPPSRT